MPIVKVLGRTDAEEAKAVEEVRPAGKLLTDVLTEAHLAGDFPQLFASMVMDAIHGPTAQYHLSPPPLEGR